MYKYEAERKVAAIACAVLAAWLLSACGGARHHVVERTTGRVDDQRCIMTSSDARWTIHHPPTPSPQANR